MLKELLKGIIVLSSVIIIQINVFAAVQTPSNMSYDPGDVVVEYNPDVMENFSDEEIEIFDAEFIDNTEASDRDVAEYIKDLFIMAVSEVMPIQEDDDEGPEDITMAEHPILLLSSRNSATNNIYKNTVVYEGTFNNTSVRLVIPYSDYSSLNVIDGKLLNVGHSSISGRMLYEGEELNSTDYETYSYILNPVYGSTSNVYQYGSFNYQRHYYLSTGTYNSIRYSDIYGDFYVEDITVYYSSSERQLYTTYLLIVLLGMVFLWMRKRS